MEAMCYQHMLLVLICDECYSTCDECYSACESANRKACELAKLLLNNLLNEQCKMSVIADSKANLCHHCYNKAKKCVDLIDDVRQKKP